MQVLRRKDGMAVFVAIVLGFVAVQFISTIANKLTYMVYDFPEYGIDINLNVDLIQPLLIVFFELLLLEGLLWVYVKVKRTK